MKLLIVDDEPLIHVSIEFSLKKLETGDIEIFHAYNGPQMFEQMAAVQPQLALVDIQLPGINGLQTIRQAKEQWPDTVYYVMSSYSEFEYAREALRLNVVEYLLKPLDPETLKKVIGQVRQWGAERDSKNRLQLESWLEGTLYSSRVCRPFPKGYTAMALLYTRDGKNPKADLPAFDGGVSIQLQTDSGTLCCLAARQQAPLESLRQMLTDTLPAAGTTLFLTDISENQSVLEAQIHLCLHAAPIRAFWGIQRVYGQSRLRSASEQEIEDARLWIRLGELLQGGDFSGYTGHIQKCGLALRKKTLSTRERGHLLRYLEAVTGGTIPPDSSVGEIEQFLTDAGNALLQNKNVDKLDLVLAYVAEHYCEDVSLATLAGAFDLTPNYLGGLLKNRVGVKYTDYLTALRLSKAKELLTLSNQSVRVIAEQVGYYSLSYFTKLFQEKEGCTPAEFRSRRKG